MLIRLWRTALSKTPHALADGLMLVFQHPVGPMGEGLSVISTKGRNLLFNALLPKDFSLRSK
jgi:hypothetical protein